jgi:hypothetical protein
MAGDFPGRRPEVRDSIGSRLRSSQFRKKLTVNAIETGRYDPSLPLAFKIAEVFALQIEEIFSPNGQPA